MIKPEQGISIIVTTHNLENYIAQTIQSILRASSPEDQIILVDDGSSDLTLNVVEQLQKKHGERLTIIAQENGGVSRARNVGLRAARKDYIWYVDGDDLVVTPGLDAARAAIQRHQPDIVVGDFRWYHDQHERFDLARPHKYRAGVLTTDSEEIISGLFENATIVPWKGIFKKTLLNNLGTEPFPEGKVFEDISIIPVIFANAKSIVYIASPLIDYRQREGSITKVRSFKYCKDHASSLAPVKKVLEERPLSANTKAIYDGFCARTVYYSLMNLFQTSPPPTLEEFLEIRQLALDNFMDLSKHLPDIHLDNEKETKRFRAAVLHPSLFFARRIISRRWRDIRINLRQKRSQKNPRLATT